MAVQDVVHRRAEPDEAPAHPERLDLEGQDEVVGGKGCGLGHHAPRQCSRIDFCT